MADQLGAVFPHLNRKLLDDTLKRCDGNVEAAAEQLLAGEAAGGDFVLVNQETQEASVLGHRSWPSPTTRRTVVRGGFGDLSPVGQPRDDQPAGTCISGNGSGDTDQRGESVTNQCQPHAHDQAKKRGVLIILRGLPGSGKSTLARKLAGSTGLVCSTDDHFMVEGRYCFDPTRLEYCHEQNRLCAQKALEKGLSPVVIDNTNTTVKEMMPYMRLAMCYDYDVQLKEPETEWKFDVEQLSRRNSHGVSSDKLEKMRQRYQHNVTVENIVEALKLLDEKSTSSVSTQNRPSTSRSLSEPGYRTSNTVTSEQTTMVISTSPDIHARLHSGANDHSVAQSKELSKEQLARNIQSTSTRFSQCQVTAAPTYRSGLDYCQLIDPLPPCPVDDHTKHFLLASGRCESEPLSEQAPSSSDSGLESDLTPLSYPQSNPLVFSDSEATAKALLVSPDFSRPVEDIFVSTPSSLETWDNQMLSDLAFLQTTTNYEDSFLMSLYLKCGFDLEKTMDIALAYSTDNAWESDTDVYKTASDISIETGAKQMHPSSSSLGLDLLEPEGSVVTDNGGTSEDTNLILKLTPSLAVQLQKLFGNVDKSLLCGGEEDFNVLLSENAAHHIYKKWVDTLKARKEAQIEEHRMETMRKDAEIAHRLQNEVESNGEYRREQRTRQETTKNYKQALTPKGQSSDQETVQSPILQAHKPAQCDTLSLESAKVKESCEVLPAFKAQVEQLYDQFPKLDRQIIDAELVKNSYDFRCTFATLSSQITDTTDGNGPSISEPQRHKLNKSKEPPVQRVQAVNMYQIGGHDRHVTYNEIRAEAAIQAKLRTEAFRKAAQARRLRDDAKTSHYLQEADLCTRRMKEANQRAADLLIKIQQRPHTLDLHGLFVDEALQALDKRLKTTGKGSSLVVITGRGIHSVGGTAKLKPAVMSYLKSRNYRYEELNAGTLQVFGL